MSFEIIKFSQKKNSLLDSVWNNLESFYKNEQIGLAINAFTEKSKKYSHPSLDEAIKAFVKDFLSSENFKTFPVNSQIGWSGNKTYWIVDATSKEKILFLKTYQIDKGCEKSEVNKKRFLDEMRGFYLLQDIPEISTPVIQATGHIKTEKETYLVVLESLASGSSFQSLFEEVKKYSPDPELRREAIKDLQEAAMA